MKSLTINSGFDIGIIQIIFKKVGRFSTIERCPELLYVFPAVEYFPDLTCLRRFDTICKINEKFPKLQFLALLVCVSKANATVCT